ncbi:helix-turn-helix transcriptional regulator [Paenibacillus taichungensis]|uniref:helix-turn-helix domain-containing protein n=1 Tax=Paenibacillus taichungensis TaxID=484184 RepID=UPI002DB6141C|nr:helix-turn-helix transcriptional regulator [Paenibacillus taichungensis]MEC0110375.1 helix-turn-helix transcriptional regulator [Paenibacillus taichungensis]MEC0200051.1 helix-turn-helix transcriptional regulator [Paenibacillus taichungensis]
MNKISLGRCLLQHWLDHRDMTQAEFARITGISPRMVSHYCNGTQKMTVEVLILSSLVLDVPMDKFYKYTSLL